MSIGLTRDEYDAEVAEWEARIAEQEVLINAVREYLVRFLDKDITADHMVSALLVLFSEEEEDGRE
jgi:hypothetical protein